MVKTIERYLGPIRYIYLCALTVYTILREVIPLKNIIGNELFAYTFFGIGLLIIGASLVVNRNFLRVTNARIQTAFIVVCILSTLINFRFDLLSNIKAIGWMCIFFFLIYPCGYHSRSNRDREITIVFTTAVITFSVLMIVSLPMYFLDIGYTYFNFNAAGIPSSQGFSSEFLRLWGVFQEANYAAVYAAVTLLMTIYLFLKKRNPVVRALLVLAGIMLVTFMVLTVSRTVQLMMMLVCGWAAFYTAFTHIPWRSFKKVIASAACYVLAILLCYGAFSGIRYTLPYLKNAADDLISDDFVLSAHKWYDDLYIFGDVNVIEGFLPGGPEGQGPLPSEPSSEESSSANTPSSNPSSQVTQTTTSSQRSPSTTSQTKPSATASQSSQNTTASQTTTQNSSPTTTKPQGTSPTTTKPQGTVSDPDKNGVQKLDREDLENKNDISNGRFRRWREGLEVFLHAPLLGTSPRGTSSFAKIHCPETYIAIYNYDILNFLIELLVGTGIIGFLIALFLLARTAATVLRSTFGGRFDSSLLLFSSIALGMICASVLESDLFFNLTFGGTSFWLVMGVLNSRNTAADPSLESAFGDGADDTKTRVLIYGPKDPIGGVERIVFDYVKNIMATHDDISFDFLEYGDSFSMEAELQALGCRVKYIPSRGADFFGYKKALEALFRENRYTAVWGNYSGLTNIDLLVLAKKHGVPVRIAHSHLNYVWWGSPIMKYVVWTLHRWNKLRLPLYATDYWACSTIAGEFMFPRCTHDKLCVVNNAIDVGRFHPDSEASASMREALGFDRDALVIGHVARMCTQKNQVFLLQVMAELLKLQPNAKLLFVGDGELRQQIEDETDRLNIWDSVVFTGERSDIPELVRAMDVFVLPSLVEGFGICILEAQACGIPCVVSDQVPTTADVSGAVRFVPLEQPAEVWAKAILEQAGVVIEDPTQKVIDSGFEIVTEANKLYPKFLGGTV